MVFVDCLNFVVVAGAHQMMFHPMVDVGARADLSAPSVDS